MYHASPDMLGGYAAALRYRCCLLLLNDAPAENIAVLECAPPSQYHSVRISSFPRSLQESLLSGSASPSRSDVGKRNSDFPLSRRRWERQVGGRVGVAGAVDALVPYPADNVVDSHKACGESDVGYQKATGRVWQAVFRQRLVWVRS